MRIAQDATGFTYHVVVREYLPGLYRTECDCGYKGLGYSKPELAQDRAEMHLIQRHQSK